MDCSHARIWSRSCDQPCKAMATWEAAVGTWAAAAETTAAVSWLSMSLLQGSCPLLHKRR